MWWAANSYKFNLTNAGVDDEGQQDPSSERTNSLHQYTLGPFFEEAMGKTEPTVLKLEHLPVQLIEGIQWRGFGEVSKQFVIFPMRPTNRDSSMGFLFLGLNPRTPYDEDYQKFVSLLSRQLITSLASIVLYEEELLRGQKAVKQYARKQAQLSEKLESSEQKFQQRFATFASRAQTGIFEINPNGEYTYCNDAWYEISGLPRENPGKSTFMSAAILLASDSELEDIRAGWDNLVISKKTTVMECRLKRPWKVPDAVEAGTGEEGSTWVQFSAYPDLAEDGSVRAVMGTLSDISHLKWAEELQKRRMEEAVEARRSQENFIDMTSHEIRNPLSAVIQCSDATISVSSPPPYGHLWNTLISPKASC